MSALICDTDMWDAATPAITTMLRGLCGEEIVIHAADRDLHSGFYGSAAANPNHVLARILADLRDAEGRVTLPGFYDGVPELPDALRDSWDELGFSARRFLGEIGLSVPAGEKGRSVLEMTWSRPTCEVNGMGGGYQGAGFKTVIPAEASAKVSFRLVFDQDPHKVRAAFREHRARRGCRPTAASSSTSTAPGAPSPSTRPARSSGKTARRAHRRMGQAGGLHRRRRLDPGDDAEFKEYARDRRRHGRLRPDDDRIHSPNEKYDLKSFHKGIRSWARILQALAS